MSYLLNLRSELAELAHWVGTQVPQMMRHTQSAWLLAAGFCLPMLAGCAQDPAQLRAFLAQAHSPVGSTEYRVMPPDVISITARPSEEYRDLTIQLGPDGRAFLPLVGEFPLANKTTTELAAELTDRLKEYYQDVQVTVTVRQYNSRKYFVFGQVARPGAYPYTGGNSLLSALAEAQPTTLAMPERIQLVRGEGATQGGFEPTVDGHGRIRPNARKLTVNLNRMINDGDLSANVLLAHNDVIFVPANPLAAVGLAIQNVLFPIRPATETVATPGRMAAAAP